MLDRTTEPTARDRLEASRMAVWREMGMVAAVPSSSLSPDLAGGTLTSDGVEAGYAARPSVSKSRTPLWQFLGRKAVTAWWTRHPLPAALQMLRPVLQPHARRHPAMVIGAGMAAGSALYVLRPWRLLSVATLIVWGLRGPALPRKIFGWLRRTRGAAG